MTTKSLVKNVVYLLKVAKFSDGDGTFNSDNEYLTIINTAAVKRMDLLEYYDSRKNILDIERNTLFLLAEELKRFKKEKGLKDFNDLLEDFLTKENHNKFKVLFIDEAQDLSLLAMGNGEKDLEPVQKKLTLLVMMTRLYLNGLVQMWITS